jgi:hypothetical protein
MAERNMSDNIKPRYISGKFYKITIPDTMISFLPLVMIGFYLRPDRGFHVFASAVSKRRRCLVRSFVGERDVVSAELIKGVG